MQTIASQKQIQVEYLKVFGYIWMYSSSSELKKQTKVAKTEQVWTGYSIFQGRNFRSCFTAWHHAHGHRHPSQLGGLLRARAATEAAADVAAMDGARIPEDEIPRLRQEQYSTPEAGDMEEFISWLMLSYIYIYMIIY